MWRRLLYETSIWEKDTPSKDTLRSVRALHGTMHVERVREYTFLGLNFDPLNVKNPLQHTTIATTLRYYSIPVENTPLANAKRVFMKECDRNSNGFEYRHH